MPGYTYLWEFIVKPHHCDEFQREYGPGGPWVALFRRAPGYIDTLLLRDRSNPQRFIIADRWKTADAHGAFLAAFSAEYAALDARCAHFTGRETPVGEFDEAAPQ